MESEDKIEKIKKIIERRLHHSSENANELENKHGSNPTEKYNYYGGWSLGYWKGRVSLLEELLDELEE